MSEELDANELGVALETRVDVLAEVKAPVTAQVVRDLAALARTMAIDYDIPRLLGPFVVRVDDEP